MNDERDLPHDIGAEKAVLGAALLDTDGQVLGQILEISPPAVFYRPAHGEILALIQELADLGKPHDPVAVNSVLLSRGRSVATGGAPYLHELTEAVPAPANGPFYAHRVADAHMRRQIIAAGTRMSQIGFEGQGETEDLIAHAVAATDHLDPGSTRSETVTGLAEGFAAHMDLLERGRPEVPTIPVPFADLSELLKGGFAPGHLVTVGALSSHGKTVLAMDLARCAAADGKRVLFHSLEMPQEQLQERITAAETSIAAHRLKIRPDPASFSEAEMERLAAYAGRVHQMDLTIDDEPEVSLATVKARVASMERRGRKPHMLVIDYLQLMKTTDEERRDLELGRITRGLKVLAKTKGLCIVLLAQVAKGVAERTGGDEARPKMRLEDFRESAMIGHDSDVAIMIDNHNKTDPEGPLAGTATLHVVKNRMGFPGAVQVGVEFHYSRFSELGPR